jgi:uncharacterized protein YfkK (UPF0435 family)
MADNDYSLVPNQRGFSASEEQIYFKLNIVGQGVLAREIAKKNSRYPPGIYKISDGPMK